MTTFYNFAFKIETIWARNANNIVFVWFIHSRIKKVKNMECKKEYLINSPLFIKDK